MQDPVRTPRWLPFSSAMTSRARKAWAFLSAMEAGECSCVKRATVVTKVLRSMSMLSRLVTRTAATSPARHKFTVVPVDNQSLVTNMPVLGEAFHSHPDPSR